MSGVGGDETASHSENEHSESDEACKNPTEALASAENGSISDDGDVSDDVCQELQAAVIVNDGDEDCEHPDTNDDGIRSGDAVIEAVAVVADDDFDDDDDDDDKPLNSLKISKKKAQKRGDSTGKKKENSGSKKRKQRGKTDEKNAEGNLQLSNTARAVLLEAVPAVPVQIGDNVVVRSFGRLNVSDPDSFSTESALYPVGFSCDRYEYSPVHGRVIKLRCTILDGKRTEMNYRGPLFRVMWGQGVNEDVDQVEYPYDPKRHSPPIQGKDLVSDAESIPALSETTEPVNGMKVRVRFENDRFYYGTIESVVEKSEENKKRRKRLFEISILYEDGSMEEATYPDPDIRIVMPGYDEEMDHENIDLKQLNGKPVHTATGKSPLEAWSLVIQKLGLVDEFIVESGLSETNATKEDLEDLDTPESSERINDKEARNNNSSRVSSTSVCDESVASNGDDSDESSERESPTEIELKERVERLKAILIAEKEEDKAASVALADVRISLLGTLACNPFANFEGSFSHQESWIAAAVRKEKAKMGSTGNKRKIVTAADIVQRNNSFFNPDIEALIEGLPGSEQFHSYESLERRSGLSAISKSYIQEQQMLQANECRKGSGRDKMQKAKSSQDKERERKRKKREDERDARKRQKLEEEEEKKKARAEERLVRLRVQVEERMFKEASFQREKVILAMVKSFGKEMARRRKAAELVSAQKISDKRSLAIRFDSKIEELPPLSKPFDEDVLRIWDFISTFGSFFLERGYVGELPTLDALQSSIDTLRGSVSDQERAEAISFITNLAVALCKPLSAGLTRMLFASLIALNPTLQKDFGAAFFNEQSATEVKDVSDDASQLKVLLPVNILTWKEVARIAFLSDALGELGHNRQEQAHYLRGYRSTGHPNSKEARRLRRVEDFAIAVLRQSLIAKHLPEIHSVKLSQENRIRINVPSSPTCDMSTWLFQLHKVLSLKSGKERSNYVELLERAREQLQELCVVLPSQAISLREVEKILIAAKVGVTEEGSFDAVKIKQLVGDLFSQNTDWTIGKDSGNIASRRGVALQTHAVVSGAENTESRKKPNRPTMGKLESLELTPKDFKDLTRVREKYMSDALVLKEHMKRQELKEAGEEDEEDDEEEDDDEIGQKDVNSAVAVEISNERNEIGIEEKDCQAADAAISDTKQRIGKETPHDDFCGDIPCAPELIRRCLAVLRTVCQSGPAEPFIFPVDPQSNPGYYDMLLKPMCMREVGIRLQKAAKDYQLLEGGKAVQFLENVVADFARNIRLIGWNCLSYANAGPTVISAGGEMLRIFERLLLDWVLAPPEYLTPLHRLDDDICVDPHPSDSEATVLLCDGCEGNFNVSRLDPPLLDIPKGDWYCPRCVSGRWWGDLDPRIGKALKLEGSEERHRVKRCLFSHFEQSTPSLMYEVENETSGGSQVITLEDVDMALSNAGESIPGINCLVAVAESFGHGSGIDRGLRQDLVPVLLNPNVSDGAAQVALSSSVFRDSIAAAGTLLIADDREMTASEWLRLLLLLTMKCASSDMMQSLASDMENKAAEIMNKRLESLTQIDDIFQVFAESFDERITDSHYLPPSNNHTIGIKEAKHTPETTYSQSVANSGVATITIDPNAVEVLDSLEGCVSGCSQEINCNDDRKAARSAAILQKSQRQKSREDCIAAFCIEKQLRSTFASFCEDTISELIESTLISEDTGLNLASSRCEGSMVCDFCGLPDTALGTNLVRVPTEEEWDDRILHASKSRKTFLIAEVGSFNQTCDKRFVAVTLRLGGEIIWDDSDRGYHEDIIDGGMLEFVPRNADGFQEELSFSYELCFPFVTGSLSAHECCAIAAHNARKLMVVAKYKEHEAELAERDAGIACGRTLEIGSDAAGRSFWKFNADRESLYVCQSASPEAGKGTSGRWERFADPESIASVIVCLKKDPITSDLKRCFPKARSLIQTGKWSQDILNRRFNIKQLLQTSGSFKSGLSDDGAALISKDRKHYTQGDIVIVESDCGKFLWNARVIGVSKRDKAHDVYGYKVSYSGWGSRFDELVVPSRVLHLTDKITRAHEEHQNITLCDGLPEELIDLRAREFLHAKDRARGLYPLPDFAKIAKKLPQSSAGDRVLSVCKAAILAIELALPIGSVNTNSLWKTEYADRWRHAVQDAPGPWHLMRCTMLLEDTISEDWTRPEISHLRSCLPGRWKALSEASPCSVAMRILLLDRGLLYGNVDKKRFRLPKSRK